MELVRKDPERAWIKALPRSKVHYPKRLADRAKYVFWYAFTPCHPLMRRAVSALGVTTLSFGVATHEGRQNFALGRLAPGVSVKEFVDSLVSQGFGNHFVAWKDAGELVSLRRVENFTHQYHVRIFADSEVRGHYEFTPECYPFSHLKAVGQEHRPEAFAKLFAGRVIA